MSVRVKPNHPLAEIIAKKLFSISRVPEAHQSRMIDNATIAAVNFHEAEISALKSKLERARIYILEVQDEAKLHGEECWWRDIRENLAKALAEIGE